MRKRLTGAFIAMAMAAAVTLTLTVAAAEWSSRFQLAVLIAW